MGQDDDQLPDAGPFPDSMLCDDGRLHPERLKVPCPHCGRLHRPLLSPHTSVLGPKPPPKPGAPRGVVAYLARCPQAGLGYRFSTYAD